MLTSFIVAAIQGGNIYSCIIIIYVLRHVNVLRSEILQVCAFVLRGANNSGGRPSVGLCAPDNHAAAIVHPPLWPPPPLMQQWHLHAWRPPQSALVVLQCPCHCCCCPFCAADEELSTAKWIQCVSVQRIVFLPPGVLLAAVALGGTTVRLVGLPVRCLARGGAVARRAEARS